VAPCACARAPTPSTTLNAMLVAAIDARPRRASRRTMVSPCRVMRSGARLVRLRVGGIHRRWWQRCVGDPGVGDRGGGHGRGGGGGAEALIAGAGCGAREGSLAGGGCSGVAGWTRCPPCSPPRHDAIPTTAPRITSTAVTATATWRRLGGAPVDVGIRALAW